MKSLLACAILMTTMAATDPAVEVQSNEIKWYTWEEAVALNEESPKKIFVDVYTSWCGWCKRMDATTFSDPAVVEYMNENFYAVKFDAEMKDEITFKNQQFKWVSAGRKGVHTLAYSLLEGKMSYPSFVTLSENYDRIAISPGYKKADQLMKELRYAAEEMYHETSWAEYVNRD